MQKVARMKQEEDDGVNLCASNIYELGIKWNTK